MVPGYGGTGYALKSSNRGSDTAWSQAQIINTDCLSVGDRLMITAKIKFEDTNGNPVPCNPFEWDYEREGGRCSDLVLYTNAYEADGTRRYEYNRLAEISLAAEEVGDDGWYVKCSLRMLLIYFIDLIQLMLCYFLGASGTPCLECGMSVPVNSSQVYSPRSTSSEHPHQRTLF